VSTGDRGAESAREGASGSTTPDSVTIVDAHEPDRLETIRALFEEFAASLDFDLSFQDFAGELARLPGDYAPPGGCLLLAEAKGAPVGCVGLRKLSDGICEMSSTCAPPRGA
jgi:putative acetyltransferase